MNSTNELVESLELSADERVFLRGLIREHLEYYRMLASHSQCGVKNRQRLEFFEALWRKLAS